MYLLVLLLFSTSSFAAGGFEKPALWSAKAVSLGGVAASQSGADSLYFNPAGLNSSEVNLHYSVYSGYLKSDVTDQNRETTNKDLIHAGGALGSYNFGKVTLGLGAYGLAGLDTNYEKVNFSKVDSSLGNYVQDVYGKLSVMEFSLGAGVEVSNNWRVGVSIRGQQAQAKFKDTAVVRAQGLSGFGVSDGTILAASTAQFDNLKGSSFGSYKLGVQYQSDDKKTGFGLAYRSPVKIKVKGDLKGKIAYTGTGAALTGATAGQQYDQTSSTGGSLESSIPQQVVLDSHHFLNSKFLILGGVSWTQYSSNKKMNINGDLTNTLDNSTASLGDMHEHKHDMYDLKSGIQYEYTEDKFLRAGIAYTTAVTNKNYSAPTAAPPGSYSHYAIGWGSSLSEKWFLDLAMEYYKGSGSGTTPRTNLNSTSYVASVKNKQASEVYAGFLSLNRRF
jgi:long-subunit fatty acid transport protein